jgi:hypothetical protein
MIRVKGRYRNQVLELDQPLQLPEGAEVEVVILTAEETEKEWWSEVGMSRLEEEWGNLSDAVYDDWKKPYGV